MQNPHHARNIQGNGRVVSTRSDSHTYCPDSDGHDLAIQQFNTLLAQLRSNDLLLGQFLADFGDSLFDAVSAQNRPIYTGQTYPAHEAVMDGLSRQLFDAQRQVVRAVNQLLLVEDKPAAVINAEMGTGKTMMAIAAAAVAHEAGLFVPWCSARRIWCTSGGARFSKPCRMHGCGYSTAPIRWPNCCKSARCVSTGGAGVFSCWAGCGCAWATIGGRPIQYANSTALLRMPPAMKTSASTGIFCCPRCGSEIRDDENKAYGLEEVLQRPWRNPAAFVRITPGAVYRARPAASHCGRCAVKTAKTVLRAVCTSGC